MTQQVRLQVGLLVNPYAGIGGEAALKGSDSVAIREQALSYSENLRSPRRTSRFLDSLGQYLQQIDWYCGSGLMGEELLVEHGIQPFIVPREAGEGDELSSALDTVHIAQVFLENNLDLLLFVGGDGTARDILDVIGQAIPCLGIPAGVKMQSGVFAITPETAAEIVKAVIASELLTVSEQDVRDIDEQALREGRVRSRFYGSMRVPAEPCFLQHLKQGSVEDETLVLDELASHLTEIMQDDGRLMLVGPGRTLAYWMESLGLKNTLVGFDAIMNGELVQSDLNAKDILGLQKQYKDLQLVISPTGSQGALIGRGNQQLTPEFIRQLNKEQWCIVASKNKLETFQKKPLIVDTNDVQLDKNLCGLYNIITSYHHQVLYPVNISYKNL